MRSRTLCRDLGEILNKTDKHVNKIDNAMDKVDEILNDEDKERLRERYLETSRRLSGLPDGERAEQILRALFEAYADGMQDEFIAKIKGAAPGKGVYL